MLLSFFWVREYSPSLVNLFKHFFCSCLFLIRTTIFIWMPLKGKFSVSIFNFLLFVALFNAQNLVIVFLLSSFGFLLRKLKFLLYLESCRVDASSRAVVVD